MIEMKRNQFEEVSGVNDLGFVENTGSGCKDGVCTISNEDDAPGEQIVENVEPIVIESVKEVKIVEPTISIGGLWSKKAGTPEDETPSLTASVLDEKLFYMIKSDGVKGKIDHITDVFINDSIVHSEQGQIKGGDKTDTGVIPVPSRFRRAGQTNKVLIKISTHVPGNSERTPLYTSPEFTVTYL